MDDSSQPEEYLKTSRLRPTSPMRTPSSDSTQRGFSSLDTDKDLVDSPILDEFAQYLNASIHPPNELSVPRCYETIMGPVSPTRLSAPSTAPSSRRPSTSSKGAMLLTPNHRYARSLSLGYTTREVAASAPAR